MASSSTPTALTFRTATPADVPAVLRLVRSAYRGDSSRSGWTTEADLVADDRISESGVRAIVHAPDAAVLVAHDAAGLLAACCEVRRREAGANTTVPPSATATIMAVEDLSSGTETPPATTTTTTETVPAAAARAYFGMFAVDPTRQAGGIGRQVLAHAEAFARDEWNTAVMEMCVIWTREELISWYLRRGYTKTDRTLPFPYAHLVNGEALRDDLYFTVLEKPL